MNEVEKMYENAGVEKHYCSFESFDGNVYNWELNEDGEEKYNKCFIGKPKIKQRSFTAEKQLSLIKWLAETRPIHINLLLDKWTIEGMVRYGIKYDTFEDALSGYINQIWQDLTEEERKQIKNILESEVRE